jgi:hypothetical protein
VGRARNRRREKALEEAIAKVLAAGIRAGRRKALQDALELTARKLFADEERLVLALLEEGTPEQVMEALPRLRDEVMAPRWAETMRPLLADIIAAQVRHD